MASVLGDDLILHLFGILPLQFLSEHLAELGEFASLPFGLSSSHYLLDQCILCNDEVLFSFLFEELNYILFSKQLPDDLSEVQQV